MSNYLPASFDGIAFPVRSITLLGAIRHHQHEYPHTPGSDPEKMGRKSYVIRMEAIFSSMDGPIRERYPDLYPNGLKNIRSTFEQQKTSTLVIPTVGSIQAYAGTWQQKWTSAILDGETMELEWYEDQSADFLVSTAFEFGANDVVAKAKKVRFLVSTENFDPETMSLFDALNNAVGAFTKARDQVGRQLAKIENKIRKVETLCGQIKRNVEILKSAEFVRVSSAVTDLQYAALVTAQSIAAPVAKILKFIAPVTSSVTDLSIAIYGNTARAMDILKLNEFADALRIPPGTVVRYSK